MQQLMCQQAISASCLKGKNHHAGWLFGSSSKKKSKFKLMTTYVSPVEQAQKLTEGRAIDLAALLELKQLIHYRASSFFDTWVEEGNPCNFAKVQDLSTCCSATAFLLYTLAHAAQLMSEQYLFVYSLSHDWVQPCHAVSMIINMIVCMCY